MTNTGTTHIIPKLIAAAGNHVQEARFDGFAAIGPKQWIPTTPAMQTIRSRSKDSRRERVGVGGSL
jgi:hypothetical protein